MSDFRHGTPRALRCIREDDPRSFTWRFELPRRLQGLAPLQRVPKSDFHLSFQRLPFNAGKGGIAGPVSLGYTRGAYSDASVFPR